MKYTVYLVTNLVNGKMYLGKHQTEDPEDGYLGSGNNLRASVEKYGSSNFKKVVLHVFDSEEEMNSKEKELVTEEWCKRSDTYNICEGGKGGWSYINRELFPPGKKRGLHTPEWSRHISEAKRGRPSHMKGKTYEQIHGERASSFRKFRSESNRRRGPLSEETKMKISRAKMRYQNV